MEKENPHLITDAMLKLKLCLLQKLDIKDKHFAEDKKVGRLTLVWNTEKGEPELKQVIQIFSAVDCVLKPGELPLQWMVSIDRWIDNLRLIVFIRL